MCSLSQTLYDSDVIIIHLFTFSLLFEMSNRFGMQLCVCVYFRTEKQWPALFLGYAGLTHFKFNILKYTYPINIPHFKSIENNIIRNVIIRIILCKIFFRKSHCMCFCLFWVFKQSVHTGVTKPDWGTGGRMVKVGYYNYHAQM